MAFIKDGETKVYKDKIVKDGKQKNTSKKESSQYTIDDLVQESLDQEEGVESGEEDVFN